MYRNILNKKAAIGETITWTVATIIIIGALIIFLVLSSLLAKVKLINFREVKSDVEKESPVLTMKTSISHDIADERNKTQIDNILEEWNNE